MTSSRNLFLSLTATTALVCAAVAGDSLSPQSEAGPDTEEGRPLSEAQLRADSIACADSIALAETNRLVNRANNAYKDLKFVQYDGITEAELYPRTLEVYGYVTEELEAPLIDRAETTKAKGMLLDLSNLLAKGTVFYSNQSDAANMARCATAYADTRLNPMMADMHFSSQNDNIYPFMLHCAASNAYNDKDYDRAAGYLEAYLGTSAQERREQVCIFFGQACLNSGQPQRAVEQLVAAVPAYPANYQLLRTALKVCLDAGASDKMQPLLDKALLMRPNDEELLSLQGRLYEEDGNYSAALGTYQQLYDLKPNSLQVNKHLALCYYNIGVEYYHKANTETDDKAAKRFWRQSNAYLSSAADRLAEVVANDPNDMSFLNALAETYGCLGRAENLEEINTRLVALGMSPKKINEMPAAITFGEGKNGAAVAQTAAVPDFQTFAQAYVEKHLGDWARRGEFEKAEEYEKRMDQETVFNRYKDLSREAENEYMRKYASKLRISDLKLGRYDVDNESYMITSTMGPIIVNVPLKNKEAETFKAAWNSIQLRNPRYFIQDNAIAIASVDLVTPAGKTYHYDSEKAANYGGTNVIVDVNSIIRTGLNQDGGDKNSYYAPQASATTVIRAKSDVDVNIPVTSRVNGKTVALIFANENYKNVSEVASALNDGETFAKYCHETLGIPENQVMLYRNATYAEMLSGMSRMRKLVSSLGNGIDVIVFYAGHGFPDEASKDAYLLPVDGDGVNVAASYPLKKFYSDLYNSGAENVMVFLDACFSGSARDGGMLANARGVALKAREAAPEGNMFVLSAASDKETAMPYKEKNHGLFTYYLLKKIQNTKGNVSLKEISDFVEQSVRKNSVTVNNKLQTPRTSVSGRLATEWQTKKLRP